MGWKLLEEKKKKKKSRLRIFFCRATSISLIAADVSLVNKKIDRVPNRRLGHAGPTPRIVGEVSGKLEGHRL